jgi:hypothetical protein
VGNGPPAEGILRGWLRTAAYRLQLGRPGAVLGRHRSDSGVPPRERRLEWVRRHCRPRLVPVSADGAPPLRIIAGRFGGRR